MSIAKNILIKELNEQKHLLPVGDVIFQASEYYCTTKPADTFGRVISYYLKQRIIDEANVNSSKDILLQELKEQGHPERVEDVIFWALEAYYKCTTIKNKTAKMVAISIVERINEAETAEFLFLPESN